MPAVVQRPIAGDVETTIRRFERATAQADAEVLLQLVSERFFDQTYGALGVSREALLASPDLVLGQRVARVVDSVEISGALASVRSHHPVGSGAVATETLELIRQAHGWLVDAIRPTVSQGTSGARAVDVTLRDFTFDMDPAEFSAGLPLRVRVRNNGSQPHMMALWHITSPGEPIELIESTDSPPGQSMFTAMRSSRAQRATSSWSRYLRAGICWSACWATSGCRR
jgi:hypothetical protein